MLFKLLYLRGTLLMSSCLIHGPAFSTYHLLWTSIHRIYRCEIDLRVCSILRWLVQDCNLARCRLIYLVHLLDCGTLTLTVVWRVYLLYWANELINFAIVWQKSVFECRRLDLTNMLSLVKTWLWWLLIHQLQSLRWALMFFTLNHLHIPRRTSPSVTNSRQTVKITILITLNHLLNLAFIPRIQSIYAASSTLEALLRVRTIPVQVQYFALHHLQIDIGTLFIVLLRPLSTTLNLLTLYEIVPFRPIQMVIMLHLVVSWCVSLIKYLHGIWPFSRGILRWLLKVSTILDMLSWALDGMAIWILDGWDGLISIPTIDILRLVIHNGPIILHAMVIILFLAKHSLYPFVWM